MIWDGNDDKREIKVKRARSDKIFLSSSRRHPRRQSQPNNSVRFTVVILDESSFKIEHLKRRS